MLIYDKLQFVCSVCLTQKIFLVTVTAQTHFHAIDDNSFNS